MQNQNNNQKPNHNSNQNHNQNNQNHPNNLSQNQGVNQNPNSNQKQAQTTTDQKVNQEKTPNSKQEEGNKKLNTNIGWVITALVIIGLIIFINKKQDGAQVKNSDESSLEQAQNTKGETYTYTMHDISLVLPAGFTPLKLEVPSIDVDKYVDYQLPEGAGSMRYITDMKYWHQNEKIKLQYEFKGTKQIGNNIFAVYDYRDGEVLSTYYLYQIGNTGYRFIANSTTDELLKTFYYTKWANLKKTTTSAPITPATQTIPTKVTDPLKPVSN